MLYNYRFLNLSAKVLKNLQTQSLNMEKLIIFFKKWGRKNELTQKMFSIPATFWKNFLLSTE